MTDVRAFYFIFSYLRRAHISIVQCMTRPFVPAICIAVSHFLEDIFIGALMF